MHGVNGRLHPLTGHRQHGVHPGCHAKQRVLVQTGPSGCMHKERASSERPGQHVQASVSYANTFAVTCRSWIDLAVPAGSSSEAAAVTAGVAGLLVSLAPGLAPEDIWSALVRSAAPLPTGVTFVRLGSLKFYRSSEFERYAFVHPLLECSPALVKQSLKPQMLAQCILLSPPPPSLRFLQQVGPLEQYVSQQVEAVLCVAPYVGCPRASLWLPHASQAHILIFLGINGALCHLQYIRSCSQLIQAHSSLARCRAAWMQVPPLQTCGWLGGCSRRPRPPTGAPACQLSSGRPHGQACAAASTPASAAAADARAGIPSRPAELAGGPKGFQP